MVELGFEPLVCQAFVKFKEGITRSFFITGYVFLLFINGLFGYGRRQQHLAGGFEAAGYHIGQRIRRGPKRGQQAPKRPFV